MLVVAFSDAGGCLASSEDVAAEERGAGAFVAEPAAGVAAVGMGIPQGAIG